MTLNYLQRYITNFKFNVENTYYIYIVCFDVANKMNDMSSYDYKILNIYSTIENISIYLEIEKDLLAKMDYKLSPSYDKTVLTTKLENTCEENKYDILKSLYNTLQEMSMFGFNFTYEQLSTFIT